jgi:hypothetical protein
MPRADRFEDNPNALGVAGYVQRRKLGKALRDGTAKPSTAELRAMNAAKSRRRSDIDERN